MNSAPVFDDHRFSVVATQVGGSFPGLSESGALSYTATGYNTLSRNHRDSVTSQHGPGAPNAQFSGHALLVPSLHHSAWNREWDTWLRKHRLVAYLGTLQSL